MRHLKHALHNDLFLVTINKRLFERVPKLKTRDWL